MKYWTAILSIIFLGFQNVNFAQVQIFVYDSLDNRPVSFAHIISEDTSFQAYTNIEGEIELPNRVKSFYVTCLGYESKRFDTKDNLRSAIFYLNKSSYTLQALSISAKKLDIYKEVEKVRKKLKKDKAQKMVSTRTSFETLYQDNSIEKGEVYCRDKLKANFGFDDTERLYSDYSFDPERMFLNVDIDRLIKKVNLTEKRGYLHLFNQGKIKKKNTSLKITNEHDSLFIISYSRSGQSGYIKFNKYNHKLYEYRVLDQEVDNSIYNSINNKISVSIDSLILNYDFENGFVKNVSFFISTDVQNIGKIKTSGFVEEVNFQNRRYSTNPNLSSIQYDAYISDFSRCRPMSQARNIFYNKIVKRKSLVKDDELSVALLQKYGYAPKIKIWNSDQRLNKNDFKIFDQNIDFSRSSSLRSDFHTFQVDWVLYDDSCIENRDFGLVASIWNSDKAVFISKTKYHSLLLANLTLDIYEIFRKKLLEELKTTNKGEITKDLINEYHGKATEYINKMNSETNYGNRIEKIVHFNDYVKNNLNIDNLKELSKYKFGSAETSKYSEGDLLLAIGKEEEAIEFYLDILKHVPLNLENAKPIYENIIQAYSVLKNQKKVCEYFKKWSQISNKLSLNLNDLKVECK